MIDTPTCAPASRIKLIHEWWQDLTQPFDDNNQPRRIDTGAIARLRRARSLVDILFEPIAVQLIRRVASPDNAFHQEVIAHLAALLAHVRHDDPAAKFATRLGGQDPDKRLMKSIRFKRLLQATTLDERQTALRRAIQMLDGKANVCDLSGGWLSLAYEGSRNATKARWLIAYVGGLNPDHSDQIEPQSVDVTSLD